MDGYTHQWSRYMMHIPSASIDLRPTLRSPAWGRRWRQIGRRRALGDIRSIFYPHNHICCQCVVEDAHIMVKRGEWISITYSRCSMLFLTSPKSAWAISAIRCTELIPLINGTICGFSLSVNRSEKRKRRQIRQTRRSRLRYRKKTRKNEPYACSRPNSRPVTTPTGLSTTAPAMLSPAVEERRAGKA